MTASWLDQSEQEMGVSWLPVDTASGAGSWREKAEAARAGAGRFPVRRMDEGESPGLSPPPPPPLTHH